MHLPQNKGGSADLRLSGPRLVLLAGGHKARPYVIPAKAGIQSENRKGTLNVYGKGLLVSWNPAFAGIATANHVKKH